MSKNKKTTLMKPVYRPGTISIYPVYLSIGPWKKLFREEQNHIIIAEALNYCAYYKWMNIAGYLITNRRVCLVLEIDKADINKMLSIFYERVKKEIQRYRERARNFDFEKFNNEDANKTDGKFTNLFTQYTTVNDYLIRLITGRKVYLPYYSPHLERLKDRIHDYNFCSAIDYSGAIGPVIVKLFNEEEFFDRLKL